MARPTGVGIVIVEPGSAVEAAGLGARLRAVEHVVDPAGGEDLRSLDIAGQREAGEQVGPELDQRVAADHRVRMQAAEQLGPVEVVAPDLGQGGIHGAEQVPEVGRRREVVHRDVVGDAARRMGTGSVKETPSSISTPASS